MNKITSKLIIVFFCLSVVSCTTGITNSEQEEQTLEVIGGIIKKQTTTPFLLNTMQAKLSPTYTLVPTLTLTFEPSFSPSPYPSLTALPTYTHNDANRAVFNLVNTNGDCVMPCLWGIVPGESDWEIVKQQYLSLRFEVASVQYNCKDETKNECVIYDVDKIINDSRYGLTVYLVDGIVTKVLTRSESARGYFSLDKVLNNFGIPSDIYIETYIGPGVSTPVYFLLFYDNQSLIITYEINGNILNEVIHVCPYNYGSDLWVDVYEYNSDKYYNHKKSLLIPDKITGGRHYPIGERIGITEKEFYELFVNKVENNCIDLQIDWQ